MTGIIIAVDNIKTSEIDRLSITTGMDESEIYQLLLDYLVARFRNGESIQNFLCRWWCAENPWHRWRLAILPKEMNELAEAMTEMIDLCEINCPNVLDYIYLSGDECMVVSSSKHMLNVRF